MKSIYTSVRKNQAPLVLVGQIHSNEAFLSTSFPGNLWRNPIDAAKIHQKVSFRATHTINKTLLQPFFQNQCCQLWSISVNTYRQSEFVFQSIRCVIVLEPFNSFKWHFFQVGPLQIYVQLVTLTLKGKIFLKLLCTNVRLTKSLLYFEDKVAATQMGTY